MAKVPGELKPLERHLYVKMTDGLGNVSFIIVSPDRSVSYCSAGETPLAMSNMFTSDSVEARAKMRLAKDADDLLNIVKRYARYSRTTEKFIP